VKKESRLLRVRVLGCGRIAQAAHPDACRKARNVELYAVCDTAEDLLTSMAAVHRPSVVYEDYDAMLAHSQVEAVIVAVADQFHVPLIHAAGADSIVPGSLMFGEDPKEMRTWLASL
jgi:predicted dehydrogenase